MEVIKKANTKLDAVLIGIRYQRSWSLLDKTGEIIDKILRDKKSPFAQDSDYFTKVGGNEKEIGRVLINPDTGCSLQININDLIFKHVLNKHIKEVSKKNLSWFFSTIIKFIIPEIIVYYKIKQIMRVGIVYYHYVDVKDISMEFINKAFGDNPGEITKFNLDFHKKYIAEIAIAKKGVSDYKNAIYNIKNKNNKYEISLDYQYYFEPYNDHLEDWNANIFIESSQRYLEDIFYPWLKKIFINLNIKES